MSRDEMRSFLLGRLKRHAQFGDDSDLLDEAVLSAARQLLGLLGPEPGPDAVPDLLTIGGTHYMRHLCLPAPDDEADLLAAIGAYRLVHPHNPTAVPEPLRYAMDPAVPLDRVQRVDGETLFAWLLAEFHRSLQAHDVPQQAAVLKQFQQMLARVPRGVAPWSEFAWRLAVCYAARHDQTEHADDILAAISWTEKALADPAHNPSDTASQTRGLALFRTSLWHHTQRAEDLDVAIQAGRRAMPLISPDDPERGSAADALGRLLAARYRSTTDVVDLDDAIAALEVGCAAADDAASRGPRLRRLGDLQLERYERSAKPQDLDLAIETLAQAAQTASATPGATQPETAVSLVAALTARFAATSDITALDKAIQVLSKANYAKLLGSMADTRRLRHLAKGDDEDLLAAAAALRSALAPPRDDSDPVTVAAVMKLANTADHLYQYTGEPARRTEAISTYRLAARLTVLDPEAREAAAARARALSEDPTRMSAAVARRELLAGEAEAYRQSYMHGRRITDLSIIILLHRRLVATLGDLPAPLTQLADYLFERYTRAGSEPEDTGDISEARACITRAAGLVDSSTQPGNALVAVARAWLLDHQTTTNREALEWAVDNAINAIRLLPPDQAAEPNMILGIAQLHRHSTDGGTANAVAAAESFRLVLAAPHTDGRLRSEATAYLGSALNDMYKIGGDIKVLAEAIELLEARIWQADPPIARLFGVLGTLYTALHERTGSSDDERRAQAALAKAASFPDAPAITWAGTDWQPAAQDVDPVARLDGVIRRAGDGVGNGPASVGTWNALSGLWNERFRLGSDPADLDRSVEAGQAAVAAAARYPQLRVGATTVLAIALTERYRATHDRADIVEAIRITRVNLEAAKRAGDYDPDLHVALAMTLRPYADDSGDGDVLQEALNASREVAGNAGIVPSSRIYAANWAASTYGRLGHWREAGRLYEQAVALLPYFAPETLTLHEQHQELRKTGRNAADGAACWINAGEPERAAILLEQGRTFLLSRALTQRIALDELTHQYPDLAAEFARLRSQIGAERPRTPEVAIDSIRRDEAATELQALIERIRTLPGQDRFLRPPTADQLRAAAQTGPLVMLNCSPLRCDALVVTAERIRVVPLPDVTQDRLVRHAAHLHWQGDNDTDVTPAVTLTWLWDSVVRPVLDAVSLVNRHDEPLPRIWWIPDGIFALLPIHAAGRHDPHSERQSQALIDRVCSSYTPSIAALTRARADRKTLPPTVLVVAVPQAPGVRPLPGAALEAAFLAANTDATVLGPIPGAHDRATPAKICENLADHAIAHFACHGTGSWLQPDPPYLVVQAESGSPDPGRLRVTDLLAQDLNGVRLAYLSACSTARPTDPRLLDESVTLTSAFLRAGFSHVIGTLWEVDDHVAAAYAASVYARLHGPSGLNLADTARTVHEATRELRERFRRAPLMWASHVHLGP